MGDLPIWKIQRVFMKRSNFHGQPTYVKNMKILQNGLIVMSDLSRWKIQRFFLNDLIIIGYLPR
jgi:hypothetical protein